VRRARRVPLARRLPLEVVEVGRCAGVDREPARLVAEGLVARQVLDRPRVVVHQAGVHRRQLQPPPAIAVGVGAGGGVVRQRVRVREAADVRLASRPVLGAVHAGALVGVAPDEDGHVVVLAGRVRGVERRGQDAPVDVRPEALPLARGVHALTPSRRPRAPAPASPPEPLQLARPVADDGRREGGAAVLRRVVAEEGARAVDELVAAVGRLQDRAVKEAARPRADELERERC
jgi:hypothetical protein